MEGKPRSKSPKEPPKSESSSLSKFLKDPKVKELYRLWYEFLKESEGYKEYCEWYREHGKDLDGILPDKFKPSGSSVLHAKSVMDETYIYFDEQGQEGKEIRNFRDFGDIHINTFSEWWSEFVQTNILHGPSRPNKARTSYTYNPCPVDYYSRHLGADMETCTNNFKNEKGRSPTLDEFKNTFVEFMSRSDKIGFLTLCVDAEHCSPKDLAAELKNFLETREREIGPQEWSVLWYATPRPTDNILRVGTEKMSRYLEALRDRMKYPNKSINELAGQRDSKAEYKKRSGQSSTDIFERDIRKAKQIVKNVENGFFPGEVPE